MENREPPEEERIQDVLPVAKGPQPKDMFGLREDDEESRPRRRQRSDRGDSPIPCPACGSRDLRGGPWPWYLGTVGSFLCNVVTCRDCGHVFDTRKPQANWNKRALKLALILNGIGLVGIIAVVGGLVLLIMATMHK
ncbi:MAG TPA: hypothetical protein VGZ47_18590 [Gemmataceae bacterium]|jgi:hypothetical protein|nr:hypothetical protein [Gemmataceae bacterium]